MGVPESETVVSAGGQVWMDRNLGASRVAQSFDDPEAYGDLYQWGRGTDGHEKRNSGITSTLSPSDNPNHGDFIITSSSSLYDWLQTPNNNLWQGVDGVNNPCPEGFRIPTEAEWDTERASWSSNDSAGAWESPLKLVVAGGRYRGSGDLVYEGTFGYYWSSTINGSYARYLNSYSGLAIMGTNYSANGLSVRCIKD